MHTRILVLLLASLMACSSDGSSGAGGGGATTKSVSCRQKAGADNDDDCAGHPDQPRKLDCDSAGQTNEAIAAGCVPQEAGDSDVCCPLTVSGKTEITIACTEPADTLTDSDCAGTSQARKLDCATAAEQQAGIAVGCVPEDPGDVTDFDLCCPTEVRGVQ